MLAFVRLRAALERMPGLGGTDGAKMRLNKYLPLSARRIDDKTIMVRGGITGEEYHLPLAGYPTIIGVGSVCIRVPRLDFHEDVQLTFALYIVHAEDHFLMNAYPYVTVTGGTEKLRGMRRAVGIE
jgi:hypothetical protein